MEIEKYIIETNDNKFISVDQRESSALYVWTTSTPLLEDCWFENLEDVNEFLKAITLNNILYKNFNVYGLTMNAVSPVQIKKLSITYHIENIDKI